MPKTNDSAGPSSPWLRFLLRLPIWIYRLRMGWLLGERFLLLTHTGRKTGLHRQTVLEVVSHDRDHQRYVVAAGWGEKTQWLQNLRVHPEVRVQTGWRRFNARAERLTQEAAEEELRRYARLHPRAYKALGKFLSKERLRNSQADFHTAAELVPLVCIRTRG